MTWFIIAVKREDEQKFFPPIRATNAETAAYRRGIVPENCERVYAYVLHETPTGNPRTVKIEE